MNFKWNYCVPSSFDVSKTNKLSYNLYFYNFERAEKCVANYFFQKVSWNLTILQNTYKDCWHIYASLVKHSNEVRGHSSTTWTKFCRFLTPPPLAWIVFIPWVWTKTGIFWSPLPSSCPRSYWMAPTLHPWESSILVTSTKMNRFFCNISNLPT